jgi:HPt (histidine-containing phosphotransfer) domain-containing protein
MHAAPFSRPSAAAADGSFVEPAPAELDAGALAQLQELDPSGTSGIVKRVLQTYQRSLTRFESEVKKARDEQDQAALARLTHTLRSSSASVGALTLSALCKQVETQIREQQVAGMDVLLDALQRETGRVQTALAAMLAADGCIPPSPT